MKPKRAQIPGIGWAPRKAVFLDRFPRSHSNAPQIKIYKRPPFFHFKLIENIPQYIFCKTFTTRLRFTGCCLFVASALQLSSCVGPELGTNHCYEFSVIHENCSVAQAVNWGCENGREYRWTASCVGWFDVYHPGPIQKCFDKPLEDKGSCSETRSLPPGGGIP